MRNSSCTEEGSQHRMIVWTNGCYDILHKGHIELFKYANSLGSRLIVGIDSDRRVKQTKGSSRPINTQEERKLVLEAIRWIDHVCIYDTDEQLKECLTQNSVDIMVIGSDWKEKQVIGEKCVTKIYFFDRIEKYSTTNIINKQKKERK